MLQYPHLLPLLPPLHSLPRLASALPQKTGAHLESALKTNAPTAIVVGTLVESAGRPTSIVQKGAIANSGTRQSAYSRVLMEDRPGYRPKGSRQRLPLQVVQGMLPELVIWS